MEKEILKNQLIIMNALVWIETPDDIKTELYDRILETKKLLS